MTEIIAQLKEILAPGGQWEVIALLPLVVFGLYMLATGLAGVIWPEIIEVVPLTVEEQVRLEVEEERKALHLASRSSRPIYRVAFLEEHLRPLVEELGHLLQQLIARIGIGSQAHQELERKLDLLGADENIASFYGQKLVIGALGLVIMVSLQVSGTLASPPLLLYILAFMLGFYLPNVSLASRVARMRTDVVEQLPPFIDLFSVYVHSGSGLEQALVKVAASGSGTLPNAILRAASEAQTIELLHQVRRAQRNRADGNNNHNSNNNGPSLIALQDFNESEFKGSLSGASTNTNSSNLMIRALYHMAARFRVRELEDFVAALESSQDKGLKITEVALNMAEVMRDKKRERLTAAGKKSVVKMMIPIVICILPAFFLLILAPALIHLLELID